MPRGREIMGLARELWERVQRDYSAADADADQGRGGHFQAGGAYQGGNQAGGHPGGGYPAGGYQAGGYQSGYQAGGYQSGGGFQAGGNRSVGYQGGAFQGAARHPDAGLTHADGGWDDVGDRGFDPAAIDYPNRPRRGGGYGGEYGGARNDFSFQDWGRGAAGPGPQGASRRRESHARQAGGGGGNGWDQGRTRMGRGNEDLWGQMGDQDMHGAWVNRGGPDRGSGASRYQRDLGLRDYDAEMNPRGMQSGEWRHGGAQGGGWPGGMGGGIQSRPMQSGGMQAGGFGGRGMDAGPRGYTGSDVGRGGMQGGGFGGGSTYGGGFQGGSRGYAEDFRGGVGGQGMGRGYEMEYRGGNDRGRPAYSGTGRFGGGVGRGGLGGGGRQDYDRGYQGRGAGDEDLGSGLRSQYSGTARQGGILGQSSTRPETVHGPNPRTRGTGL